MHLLALSMCMQKDKQYTPCWDLLPGSRVPPEDSLSHGMRRLDRLPCQTLQAGSLLKHEISQAGYFIGGQTPGVLASSRVSVCTCQESGDATVACTCSLALPGSSHLWCVCSQGGSTCGQFDHASPLSESSGELSGNYFPSGLPVRHLGLPGSSEMADSRMAAADAAPRRLQIASVSLIHVERNCRSGTQMLPGSISGFYHPERYQPVRQMLERVMRASFVEIIDLRPLKDASRYPDLRGHMGWNPTNMLINMHDPTLREIQDRIVEKLRELANRARAAGGTPGDCLLLLACNKGRHRSPMIRYLTTRWMEENHGMDVDFSDIENVHWSRHGECTLARQCVQCDLYRENATRQACVAWWKVEMDRAIEYATRATWAAANEISWLGFRDLSLEVIPAPPPLPPIPDGLFHRDRDHSPPDPRSRSRGFSGGVSLGPGGSRPPPGGRSMTPAAREKGKGKGQSRSPSHQGKGRGMSDMPPNLTNVTRWNRAQQSQTGGKGAARPVTLTPAPSQGPPPSSAVPPVRLAGTRDAPIEVDPAPGDVDRNAMVIDVEALEPPVDASVDEASITYSLNLLRTALLNNEMTESKASS